MSQPHHQWHKLADYNSDMAAELHAGLLKNNRITASLQRLSVIPGMNSGARLWVHHDDLAQAKRILNNIDTSMDNTDDYDGME